MVRCGQVKKVSDFTQSRVRSLEVGLDRLNEQARSTDTRAAEKNHLEEVLGPDPHPFLSPPPFLPSALPSRSPSPSPPPPHPPPLIRQASPQDTSNTAHTQCRSVSLFLRRFGVRTLDRIRPSSQYEKRAGRRIDLFCTHLAPKWAGS